MRMMKSELLCEVSAPLPRFGALLETDQSRDSRWPTVTDVNMHLRNRYRYPYVVLSSKLSAAIPVINSVQDVTSTSAWDDATLLVKRTMMLNLLYPDAVAGKTVMVITSLARVTYVMNLLRTYHHMKLVGCSMEHDWLRSALDYVVTCPEDVRNHSHPMYICAAVVDEECAECYTGALEWLEAFPEFSGLYMANGKCFPIAPTAVPQTKWLSRCFSLGSILLEMIKSKLPEAAECPGLGDGFFVHVVETFAGSDRSIFSNDWSGVVGLMPGLLRDIDLSQTGSLVVAPASRVVALTELLQFFVQYMGLVDVVVAANSQVSVTGRRAHIVVGTPELLHKLLADSGTRTKLAKVVVVEAEQMEAEKLKLVLEVVAARGGAQLAFAAAESDSSKELLGHFVLPSNTAFIMPAKVTMSRVHVFVAPVASVEAKLEKLVEIWQRLGQLISEKWSVICNSPDMVEQLADHLEKRDVPVCVIHSGMDPEAVKERKYEFDQGLFHIDALVITDIYDSGTNNTDAIMYELPLEAEEYVRRCGNKSKMRGKVVINLVGSNDEQRLLNGFCDLHGLTLKPLPDNCDKRFLKKHHRLGRSGT